MLITFMDGVLRTLYSYVFHSGVMWLKSALSTPIPKRNSSHSFNTLCWNLPFSQWNSTYPACALRRMPRDSGATDGACTRPLDSFWERCAVELDTSGWASCYLSNIILRRSAVGPAASCMRPRACDCIAPVMIFSITAETSGVVLQNFL